MPQNGMDSLRTLMRMQSPANAGTSDPWLAKRRLEITSGLDDMLPGADDEMFMGDQLDTTVSQVGRNYTQPGARNMPIVTTSREGRRNDVMAALRQKLGLADRAHQQEMEQANLKGQYDVAGQVAGQQAAMDRLIASQAGQDRRAAGSQDTQRDIADMRSQDMADRAAEAAANRMELERFRRSTPQATEAGQRGSWMSGLWNMLFGSEQPAAPTEAPVEEAPQPQRPRIRRIG